VSHEDLSILTRPARAPDLVLRYGPIEDQVADVRLPPTGVGVRKVVLLLHGGFWRQAYDRSHLGPRAVELAGRGLVVVTPEYRRVGGGGGWPETFEDVRTCAATIPSLLADAVPASAGKPLVLSGHSAGGHLALWVAAAAPPDGLTSVLAYAPVADLLGAHRAGLGGGAALALMRAPPEVAPQRWQDADPTRLPTPRVPVTILHGRGDTVVPIGQSYAYRVTHPDTRVHVFDCGHFALIDPAARVGVGEVVEDPLD
jgi:acetyl esterase/lipase